MAMIVREGRRKNSSKVLLELDVTNGRKTIKNLKEEQDKDISFTGWIAKCAADAVSKHKILNAYRQGRKKIIIFDDVDLAIPMEREVKGKSMVAGFVLRKANEKSVEKITKEIRGAQREKLDDDAHLVGKKRTKLQKKLLKLPFFIRKLLFRSLRRNGLRTKKHLGTVGLSSMGTIANCPGWPIPIGGITSTVIGIGGIKKKPGVVDDEIKIREYLHVIIIIDHDLVDGGPLIRFVDTFTEFVESAYGLPKL